MTTIGNKHVVRRRRRRGLFGNVIKSVLEFVEFSLKNVLSTGLFGLGVPLDVLLSLNPCSFSLSTEFPLRIDTVNTTDVSDCSFEDFFFDADFRSFRLLLRRFRCRSSLFDG